MLALSMPNNRHLAFVTELILILQWVTLNESVFVLVQNSHRSCANHMTKPSISCDHVSNRVYRPHEPSPPPTHMPSNSNQFCLLMLQNGNCCHKVAAQTHVNNSTVRRVNSTITHHPPQVMLWVPNLVQKVTSGAADTATKLMRLLNWNLYVYTAKTVLTKRD